MELTAEDRRTLMDTARSAIRQALEGTAASVPELPADHPLMQPCGCFVTLHDHATHRLRGCIGRLQSQDPLLRTVFATALGTLEDPRFVNHRVTVADLPGIELEISVLTPLQPAANTLDFDLATDGLYLTFGDRAGCFLPQVARETGWDKEQLLSRLCSEKMGLSPHIWRNPHAKLQRFQAIILGPEPF